MVAGQEVPSGMGLVAGFLAEAVSWRAMVRRILQGG